MPTQSGAAGSVDVQAPPGLEDVNGFRGPSPLLAGGSPALGPIGSQKQEGLKEELVREVTAVVREHIEWKTAAAVDTLWQKGQRAMENLQQQQLARTAQLQSQLLECAKAHQNLQRENATLRSGLEALMKHLTMVIGAPPHGSMPAGVPPVVPPAAASPATAAASQAATAPKPSRALSRHISATSEAETADFHTPAGSPLRDAPSAAEELGGSNAAAPGLPPLPGFPAPPSTVGTGSERTQPQAASTPTNASEPPAQVPTFSLTLRRADNVPLGLDIVGEPETNSLRVEDIRLGGAVEAWNRQCHGDAREIRRGDHIIQINSAKEADAMQEECLKKHLLKMSVIRGPIPGAATPTAISSAAAAAAAAAANGSNGLRADASEFVPQARRSC